MLNVLLTGSVSFLITFLAVPVIIKVADQKKLFDVPDARKLHTKAIASLGGVGIFLGFLLAALFTVSSQQNPEFQYFYAAATIVFFLGLKDDILILTPFKKFLAQVAVAAIIIHLGGIHISSMHGLFGLHQLPEVFGLGLSYITIILIINAYNLIDGVDGLAGSLGLLTTCVFGSYFYMVGLTAYSVLAFAMAGSLLAFLIFNYHPAKIFMGDSGSLLLGLVNAILVIKFINIADTSAVAFPVESAVAVGIAILMVPLIDTIRVFSIRIFKGQSPFSPDRNHIHHMLLDSGLNHRHVTLCCLLLNILFISVAYYGRALGPTYLLSSITLMSLAVVGIIRYLKKAKSIERLRAIEAHPLHTAHKATKVVTMAKEEAVAAVEN